MNLNDYFYDIEKDVMWKSGRWKRVKVGDVGGWKDEDGYI